MARTRVVRVRRPDVELICAGRWIRRRPVIIASTSGMTENMRRPHVSPHVGGTAGSQMKLPTKAQSALSKSASGTKTLVARIMGFAKSRRSKIWAYETSADRKVTIARRGMVCRSVV